MKVNKLLKLIYNVSKQIYYYLKKKVKLFIHMGIMYITIIYSRHLSYNCCVEFPLYVLFSSSSELLVFNWWILETDLYVDFLNDKKSSYLNGYI